MDNPTEGESHIPALKSAWLYRFGVGLCPTYLVGAMDVPDDVSYLAD